MRHDGRQWEQLRPLQITPHVNKHAEGSVLIQLGDTHVICTATVEERVPAFLKGQNKGWITAEYSMIPRATHSRTQRESARGKQSGRTMEIQRLIGRSLRSVIDLSKLGERSITVDCDVIQADGGTRTTSITGGFVALALALQKIHNHNPFEVFPIHDWLASVSIGLVQNQVCLDLNYEEDSHAQVDMNVVMTGQGKFVELQGTGEERAFSRQEMNQMIEVAEKGIATMISEQRRVLGTTADLIGTSVHA